MLKRHTLQVLLSVALGTFATSTLTGTAMADWPEKPIKMIVGFAAGGGTDTYARVLSSLIHEELDGTPMIVINKPGAASMIALKHVAEQKPDGYTIAMMAVGNAVTKELGGDAPVNFRNDMIPIGTLGVVPGIMVVPFDSPFKTANEFFDHAKANPESLRWGHSGRGGLHHMAFSGILEEVGVTMKDVPFKGGAKTKAAVIANQVDMALMNIQHYAGFESKFRVLAVLSAERDLAEPELPSLREQGYDVSSMVSPFGVYVLAGTPDPIVERLRTAVAAVVEKKGYKNLIGKAGLKDTYLNSADSAALIEAMYKQLM